VARLLEAIRDNTDPMTLMTRVVDQALAMTSAADGAAVQVVVGPDQLTCVCGGGRLEAAVGTRLPVAGTLAGLALRTRQTLMSADVHIDSRIRESLNERFDVG
jgi:hypothetical protein